jgi:hypothetical protein
VRNTENIANHHAIFTHHLPERCYYIDFLTILRLIIYYAYMTVVLVVSNNNIIVEVMM